MVLENLFFCTMIEKKEWDRQIKFLPKFYIVKVETRRTASSDIPFFVNGTNETRDVAETDQGKQERGCKN